MEPFVIYHNPRCSKSRETLALLQARGVEPRVVLYLEQPPSAEELRQVLARLGMTPRQLLRKGEEDYKRLDLGSEARTDDELLAAMVAHPRLIERPIVLHGKRAVLGRPPENALELLS